MTNPYEYADMAHDRADREAEARTDWEEAEAPRLADRWRTELKKDGRIDDLDIEYHEVMAIALESQIPFDMVLVRLADKYLVENDCWSKLQWN